MDEWLIPLVLCVCNYLSMSFENSEVATLLTVGFFLYYIYGERGRERSRDKTSWATTRFTTSLLRLDCFRFCCDDVLWYLGLHWLWYALRVSSGWNEGGNLFLPPAVVISGLWPWFPMIWKWFLMILWTYHRKNIMEETESIMGARVEWNSQLWVCVPQKSLVIARDFWNTNSLGWTPFTRAPMMESLCTVETLYGMIPYTMIFYITRWTHGPKNLQRPIRTLIVLLGFGIKQIFV